MITKLAKLQNGAWKSIKLLGHTNTSLLLPKIILTKLWASPNMENIESNLNGSMENPIENKLATLKKIILALVDHKKWQSNKTVAGLHGFA
jgi:hypothetical protein